MNEELWKKENDRLIAELRSKIKTYDTIQRKNSQDFDDKVAKIIDAGFCVSETARMIRKVILDYHEHHKFYDWPCESFLNWLSLPGVSYELQCAITRDSRL
jgi:hypothetical protein